MNYDELDGMEPIGFTAEHAKSKIFKILTEFSANVSREKFAVSAHDIEQIRSARKASLHLVNAHFENMEKTALARRQTLIDLGDIQFASIGCDCLPRTLLTRWGLKKTAKMGELSLPFDLAIHPSAAVAHLLETDFSTYFDGSLAFDNDKDYAVNTDLGIELNHEIGSLFAAEDFAELKRRYRRRADNFISLVASTDPVVFVHHAEELDAPAISRIVANLKLRRGNKVSGFVCLYTPPYGTAPAAANLLINEGIAVVPQPYPFKDYVWHKPQHTFSLRGVEFERKIVDKLRQALSDMQLVTSPSP